MKKLSLDDAAFNYARQAASSNRSLTGTFASKKRVSGMLAAGFSIAALWVGIVLLALGPALRQSPIEQHHAKPTVKQADMHTLTSSRGFTLRYNAAALNVSGQVVDPASTANHIFGQEYTNPNELDETRPYGLVTFNIPDNGKNEAFLCEPWLAISVNSRTTLEETLKHPENAGLSELDAYTKTIVSELLTENTDESAAQPVPVTINGTVYRKVTFTQEPVASSREPRQTVYYFTIQNNQPYQLRIFNVTKAKTHSVNKLKAVLETLRFEKLRESQPQTRTR